MVDDDRARRLLGVDLPVLGQPAADAVGPEDAEELLLIAHVRARRVAEAVPAAAVLLGEELPDARRIVPSDAQLRPHALVPQLGQGFRRLHAQAMEVEILGVGM